MVAISPGPLKLLRPGSAGTGDGHPPDRATRRWRRPPVSRCRLQGVPARPPPCLDLPRPIARGRDHPHARHLPERAQLHVTQRCRQGSETDGSACPGPIASPGWAVAPASSPVTVMAGGALPTGWSHAPVAPGALAPGEPGRGRRPCRARALPVARAQREPKREPPASLGRARAAAVAPSPTSSPSGLSVAGRPLPQPWPPRGSLPCLLSRPWSCLDRCICSLIRIGLHHARPQGVRHRTLEERRKGEAVGSAFG